MGFDSGNHPRTMKPRPQPRFHSNGGSEPIGLNRVAMNSWMTLSADATGLNSTVTNLTVVMSHHG